MRVTKIGLFAIGLAYFTSIAAELGFAYLMVLLGIKGYVLLLKKERREIEKVNQHVRAMDVEHQRMLIEMDKRKERREKEALYERVGKIMAEEVVKL